MGRRKIEIKAIKDDRNRSVTFLKRKGGLFKKAHELSVLCSVDVAVIIFGSNKKLYEYSSGDIGEVLQRYNYYGQPNEHKGPADFNDGKKDDDDDDEEDIASQPSHQSPEPPSMLPPQFQTQPHIRHQTPSASPPIGNGAPFLVQRQLTPQPQHGSRPSSRNAPHRPPSNLGQHPITAPLPPPPLTYTYMQPPPVYAGNNQGVPQAHMQSGPQHHIPMQHQHQHMQQMAMQAPMHHSMQAPPPNYQYSHPPPHHHHAQPQSHAQLQVHYVDEQRRSMPPTFQQSERMMASPQPPQRFASPQPPQLRFPSPQPGHQQSAEPPHLKQEHSMSASQQQQQQLMPQPVKRMSKSRSIFTPIDESRSILSQHWASSTSSAPDAMGISHTDQLPRSTSTEPSLQNPTRPDTTSVPRSQTLDKNFQHPGPPISRATFTPPLRTNSAQMTTKRPRLKVQIPDEPSPSESGTGGAGSSPQGSTATGTDGKLPYTETSSHSSGVLLPPPSPSTGNIVSAGATGPINPFARPHPPGATSSSNSKNILSNNANPSTMTRDPTSKDTNSIMETPLSALPSRFMSNEFLPSPSSFFSSEWNFRGEGSNTLPSPLNFATPITGGFNSFLRDDGAGSIGNAVAGTKRKSPEGEREGAIGDCESESGSGAKRLKGEGGDESIKDSSDG